MGLDATVTLRKLVLGARDSETGWYRKTFTEADPIIDAADVTRIGNMYGVIQPRGARVQGFPAGIFAAEDAVMISAAFVDVGNQIKDHFSKYYEAKSYKQWTELNSHQYWETQLAELPFYEEGAVTADVVDTPADPRERTKTWIDTYLIPANITKENGDTASTITAFGYPDYPMHKVFITKGVDLVYAVMEAESTPLVDPVTQVAYGYDETIPIHILAIDKPEIMGTKLIQRGENELRSIMENYPQGSLRTPDVKRDVTQRLGSTVIYGREWRLNYKRDTT